MHWVATAWNPEKKNIFSCIYCTHFLILWPCLLTLAKAHTLEWRSHPGLDKVEAYASSQICQQTTVVWQRSGTGGTTCCCYRWPGTVKKLPNAFMKLRMPHQTLGKNLWEFISAVKEIHASSRIILEPCNPVTVVAVCPTLWSHVLGILNTLTEMAHICWYTSIIFNTPLHMSYPVTRQYINFRIWMKFI